MIENFKAYLCGASVVVFAALLMSAASCSGLGPDRNGTPGQTDVEYGEFQPVSLRSSILPMEGQSKAALQGGDFPIGSSMGTFWVGVGDTYAPEYYANTYNFYRNYSSKFGISSPYYYYYGTLLFDYTDSYQFSNVKVTRVEDYNGGWTMPSIYPCPGPCQGSNWYDSLCGGTATVYGYYPYDATVTDMTRIPLRSSIDGDDFLCAEPARGINWSNPVAILSYYHVLALVEITFRVYGFEERSSMALSNLKIWGDGFVSDGILNVKTGAVTPGTSKYTETNPLEPGDSLMLENSSIVVTCMLISVNDGHEAERRNFNISCTFAGKDRKVSLTGSNGVIVRGNYKSTVLLNIKDNTSTMEVEKVGDVTEWGEQKIEGNTAEIGGHTVTFDVSEVSGLGYDIDYKTNDIHIDFGGDTSVGSQAVQFACDYATVPDGKHLVYDIIPANACKCETDIQTGAIIVSEVSDDVTLKFKFDDILSPIGHDVEIEEENKENQ